MVTGGALSGVEVGVSEEERGELEKQLKKQVGCGSCDQGSTL